MRNLGFNIKRWISIENDPVCRSVTRKLVPDRHLQEPTNDVTRIPNSLWNDADIDLHIDTSPCQPFSRLQDSPLGFRDLERTAPMREAAKLFKRLKQNNPHVTKKLVENVAFHPSLKLDFNKFQNMWCDRAVSLNASNFGSPSSRPREYMSDVVDLSRLQHVPALSPNELLPSGRHCQRKHMPCIVASMRTRTIPTAAGPNSKVETRLSMRESESMQGWPPGIISSRTDASYSTSLQLIGNALNGQQLHAILQHFKPHADTRLAYPVCVEMLDGPQLESELASLSQTELVEWVRMRCRGWSPEPLRLSVKEGQRPYAQPRKSYSVQAGLVKSMEYALQLQVEKGYMEECSYRQGMFVSQGFVQVKSGRFFAGTDLQMVRLLADCRALNSACHDAPLHHLDCAPSQLDMCSRVPFGSKYFKFYDLSDAFHTCPIHKDCLDLVVVQFNGKFYRYLGGAQGIANMALHWNAHIMDAFDRILGEHWRDWYTLYCDDMGVHGMSRQQTENRARVLEAMLTVLEKPFSDKTKSDVDTSLDIAGLHFTEHGVRLSDEAFDTLKKCLREYSVKTVTDIQHVVGVIQYSHSAFHWPDQIALGQYSDMIGSLLEVMKEPKHRLASKWATVYPPIREKLLSLMSKNPWAYCDPRSIISDESCVVMTTDASDTAVAVTLFRVKKSDASLVTKDDLKNPEISQIIGIAYKKLSNSQRKWHTFETELYALVLGCTKFGNFITTATVKYPPSGVKKVAFWSDSTTALGRWNKLALPETVTEHLSAKARRFFSWADKVAYTKYWPMVTRHLPGEHNDISHILSHLGEHTRERHEYLTSIGCDTLACAGAMHSFHDMGIIPSQPKTPLEKFTHVHLNLSASDCDEIHRACMQDMTPLQGVPLSHVYQIITQQKNFEKLPKLERDKVRAWSGKSFHAVPAPAGSRTLLYTVASVNFVKYPDTQDTHVDRTRHLVLVVPEGAEVRVSTTAPVSTEKITGKHWIDHDLRRDILIHCHDNAMHPSYPNTAKDVRALVWFPDMLKYIKYHCESCAYCVSKRKAAQPVGVAVRAKRRLKLVEFDHKTVPDEIAPALGIAAILTVVDVVSRVTMFIPVKDVGAETTARALFTRWYPLFGVPTVFRMDGAAAFSSEVMHSFYELMGVKHLDVSAPDDPTHHAVVERRNQMMEKLLDVGIFKGDIKTADDLEMYCASASAMCNLEHVYNGFTVLEALTGEIPRAQRDLVTIPVKYSAGTALNSTFIQQLQSLVTENTEIIALLRDDDARYNQMYREVAASNKQVTNFDLRVGDQTSFNNETYRILEVHMSTSNEPMKALIRHVSSDAAKERVVKYSELRPLTDPRPVHMYSSANIPISDIKIEDFVFFSFEGKVGVLGGIVKNILPDSNTLVIHEYGQGLTARSKRRFTPLYTNSMNNRIEAKTVPQEFHTPVLRDVNIRNIHVSGKLTKNHVDADMFSSLRSLGVLDE